MTWWTRPSPLQCLQCRTLTKHSHRSPGTAPLHSSQICSILTQLHRLNLPYVAVWEHKVMQLVWQNKSRHIGLCSSQSMANVKKKKEEEKKVALTAPRTKQMGSTGFGAAGPAGSNILFTWTEQQKWAHGCQRYFPNNWPNPVHTRGLKVQCTSPWCVEEKTQWYWILMIGIKSWCPQWGSGEN